MKNQFSIFCNAAKKTIFPFFFAGDVKPSDISASNEDIITALEALSGSSSSKNRKSPRPTSVPFNKSFLSDTTAKVRAAGGLYSKVSNNRAYSKTPFLWLAKKDNFSINLNAQPRMEWLILICP